MQNLGQKKRHSSTNKIKMKNDEFWKVRIKNPTCYYFDFYYLMFWCNSSKIYIRKYLKQFSTENYKWKPVLVQNVLIPCILLIYLDQNVSNRFVINMYIENIRTFRHRKLYTKTWYRSKSLWILIIFLV